MQISRHALFPDVRFNYTAVESFPGLESPDGVRTDIIVSLSQEEEAALYPVYVFIAGYVVSILLLAASLFIFLYFPYVNGLGWIEHFVYGS